MIDKTLNNIVIFDHRYFNYRFNFDILRIGKTLMKNIGNFFLILMLNNALIKIFDIASIFM